MGVPERGAGPGEAVLRSRVLAAGMLSGVVVLAALVPLLRIETAMRGLVVPAALLGLVAPVIGYRLYRSRQERARAARAAAGPELLRATILALSVTEGAALFGLLVFALSRDPAVYLGAVGHVLLTGAVWPTRVRLESFGVEGRPPPAGG